MSQLRLYDAVGLKVLANSGKDGRAELERKLEMVKCSNELSDKEKDMNIDLINFALNGGVHYTRKDIHEDIKAGSADIDDIGGN